MSSTEPIDYDYEDNEDGPRLVPSTPPASSPERTENIKPAAENRNPRRPAFYEQPDPRDVGNPSAHDLAAENLLDLDIRSIPKPLKGIQKALRRLLGKDLEDRAAYGLNLYGQTLQPGSGRDTLIDLVQEDLDALPYAEALAYEARDDSEAEMIKAVVQSHRTAAFYSRALLAHRNGEIVIPSGNATAPAAGDAGTE